VAVGTEVTVGTEVVVVSTDVSVSSSSCDRLIRVVGVAGRTEHG